MNAFEKIINALVRTVKTPALFGTFHLISIGALLVCTILACIFLRNAKSKTLRVFVFVCWLVLVLFEAYKQLMLAFDGIAGKAVWNYAWNNFPFQFCSISLYLLPFVVFFKDCKVRDAIVSFLIFFCFASGLFVFAYPIKILGSNLGVNIQIMANCGIQVMLSAMLAVHERKKLGFKYFLSSLIVFAGVIIIAVSLNFAFPLINKTETFNMFYLSKKFGCPLPLLSLLFPKVHYAIFLTVYVSSICLVAFIVFLLFFTLAHLLKKENLARANKFKLILSTIFTAAEIALLVLVLLDCTSITKHLEFSSVALAGLFCILFINPNKNAFSIIIGLILTIFADIFLVLLNPTNQLMGVIFLVTSQLCYYLFLIANTKSKVSQVLNSATRLIITAALIVLSIIFLKEKIDALFILAIIYASNLLASVIFAFAGGKKSIAFAIGLLLLILSNAIVGLQTASGSLITIKAGTLFHKIIFVNFNLVWALYIPALTIIAIFAVYSNTLSVTSADVQVSSKELAIKQNNELVVKTGETTIINTTEPNMKIVRKHGGKTKAEINIITNNIPVEIVSSEKKTKAQKPKKEKKLKKIKIKEKTIVQENKPEPEPKEIKPEPKKPEAKKAPAQKKTSGSAPKKYSDNKPKMVVRNKIRKFDTFRKD